jgi:hypothetical protein
MSPWPMESFTLRKRYPPNIPYQRAVVWFNDEREILLLQSRYDANKAQPLSQLGWVVPVPAIPELATVDRKGSRRQCRHLTGRDAFAPGNR